MVDNVTLAIHATGFCVTIASLVILFALGLRNFDRMCASALREHGKENRGLIEAALRILEKAQAQTQEDQYRIARMHAQERISQAQMDENVDIANAPTSPDAPDEPQPYV